LKRATSAALASHVSITRPEIPNDQFPETIGDLLTPLFPHAADNPKARAALEVLGQALGKFLNTKFDAA
jgi:hypothetical protein